MSSIVAYIMVVVTTAIIAIAVTLGLAVPPAQAAAPAATSMCEPIGVVGNVIISRCLDEDTGIILYVNSAGFMLLGE